MRISWCFKELVRLLSRPIYIRFNHIRILVESPIESLQILFLVRHLVNRSDDLLFEDDIFASISSFIGVVPLFGCLYKNFSIGRGEVGAIVCEMMIQIVVELLEVNRGLITRLRFGVWYELNLLAPLHTAASYNFLSIVLHYLFIIIVNILIDVRLGEDFARHL